MSNRNSIKSVFENKSPDEQVESPFPKLRPTKPREKEAETPPPAGKPPAKAAGAKPPTPQSAAKATPKAKPSTPLNPASKPLSSPAPTAKKAPSPLMKAKQQLEGPARDAALLPPHDPTSPNSPAPTNRILLQLRPDGDKDVLSPEERRKIARDNMQLDTKSSIPQLKPQKEEMDVLPPEERRKLAASLEPREMVYATLQPDREEADVLSPEERRRRLALQREKQEAMEVGSSHHSASHHSAPSHHSTAALSRRSSHHSLQQTAQSSAPQPVRTPVRTPLSPAGFPCPRCDTLQHQLSDRDTSIADLQQKVGALQEEVQRLEAKKSSSPRGESKRHKEEMHKKDKKIKQLEQEVVEAEKRAVASAMRGGKAHSTSSLDDREQHYQTLLEQRDAEITDLKARLEAIENDHSEYEASVSAMSQADDEVTLLNSQIWSLETAIEFRTKEINRLDNLLHEFVSKVEHLDEELAKAMLRLMNKGESDAKAEEEAVLGKSVEEVLVEMKEKRVEHKQKKKRRPRKGKLSKENAELREELNELSQQVLEMKKAMASNNPSMFLNAYAAVGGRSGMPAAAGANMPTKPCCFQAAFVAAGQAESQKEQLSEQLRESQRRVDRLTSTLDRARNAIVSSAGVGYENEIKLQQAKKALQLILDFPEGATSPRSKGPVSARTAITAPAAAHPSIGGALASPPVREPRNMSPTRKDPKDPQTAVMAWITANPQHQPHELHTSQHLAVAPNVGQTRQAYTSRRL